jgi:hypothetical protein
MILSSCVGAPGLVPVFFLLLERASMAMTAASKP